MGFKIDKALRFFKVGRKIASPAGITASAFQLSDELNSDDPDGFVVAISIASIVGTVSSDVKFLLDRSREAEKKKLEPIIQALQLSYNQAQLMEEVFDKLAKVPFSQIRGPAKLGEDLADVYGDLAGQFLTQLLTAESKLETLNNSFSSLRKVLGVFDKIGDLATVLNIIRLGATFILERDAADAEVIEASLLEDLGGELSLDGETFELELPEAVLEKVNAALDAFDARLGARTDDILEAQAKLGDIVATANSLAPDGLDKFAEDLQAKLDGARAVLGNLDILDDIAGFSAIANALQDISRVLNVIVDVIQPVLDFFGPVTRLIDAAISAVEDAVGLTALRETIRKAVEDQINNLTQPIRDELQKIIDAFDIPEIELLETFAQDILSFRNLITDIELNPVAQIGEASTGERLDSRAIIVGMDGADNIALALDTKFDDGFGGLAMAGGGNDSVLGTDLADVLLGGIGNDTLIARGGDDVVIAGDGDDEVSGGDGNDAILGDDGNDVLRGDSGNDEIFAGSGNDTAFGGDGNDRIEGGDGNDFLEDTSGDNSLAGGDGEDELVVTGGTNILDGEADLDTIRTLGDASGLHTILDPTVNLVGGNGVEILILGDAYAEGNPVLNGVNFDGGGNRDTVIAGDIDLRPLAPLTSGFETLNIVAPGGEAKEVVFDVDNLRVFDRLDIDGGGAVTLNVASGAFRMDTPFDDQALLIDFNDLTPFQNPQDGDLAGEQGRPIGELMPLTIQLNGTAGGTGGFASGPNNTPFGLIFSGSAGADTIIGGSGSDVIRGAAGADILDGGPSDRGDRFELDGAIGDIFLGTPEELDGDIIRNLSNRVDRVRVLGEEDFFLNQVTTTTETVVEIFQSEADFDAGQTPISSFTLLGDYPKLFVRTGSFIDADGTEVAYTEIFNNNVPPTAVSDQIVTRNLGPGDDAVQIDPFANDFDADTLGNPDEGIVRRQIAVTESLAGLFQIVDTTDEDAARAAFQNGIIPVTSGTEITTELGNKLIFTEVDGEPVIEYEARNPSVTLRRIDINDAAADIEEALNNYDVTEDLPFFGRDRIDYKVFDLEGELSNTAAINILIRPDEITLADGTLALPTVEVNGTAIDGTPEQITATLTELAPGTTSGTRRIDFFGDAFSDNANESLAVAMQGNDYFRITDPGNYFGFSGVDVLDARNATGAVGLFGGRNADWLEGGDFDDFLTGGGFGDSFVDPSFRTDDSKSPADDKASPNILIGGGGNNVFSASIVDTDADFTFSASSSRDTIYVLDGDQETIVGPIFRAEAGGTASNTLNPRPDIGPTALTAAALQDDLVIGFDNDDRFIIPVDTTNLDLPNVTRTFREDIDTGINVVLFPFTPARDLIVDAEFTATIPQATGLIVTDADLSEFVGQDNDFLGDIFVEGNAFSSGTLNEVANVQTSRLVIFPSVDLSETIAATDAFAGTPEIITYDITTDVFDDTGGVAPTTRLSVNLEGFKFNPTVRLAGEPDFSFNGFSLDIDADFALDGGTLERTDRLIDPGNMFSGDGVSFEMDLEGVYRDRFKVELRTTNGITTAPLVGTGFNELGVQRTTSTGEDFVYIEDSVFGSLPSQRPLGLVITYDSSAPEGVADTISVQRGDAVVIDLLANDTDADDDPLQIFDFVFESALQEAALLDGDVSNGELIIQNDPNTGLGTGIITYVAPPDEDDIGPVSFSYIADDGEFKSEVTNVTINVTGQAPILGDDFVVLPFSTGSTPIPIATLLENDFDPDEGDVLQASTFDPVEAVGLSGGNVFLNGQMLNTLRNNPTGPDGEINGTVELSYTLEDASGAGRSEPATVQIAMASALSVAAPTGLTVAEDTTVAIELLSGRNGGFGDVEIVSISAPVAQGTGVEIGSAELSGDSVIFTPFADIAGVTASLSVTTQDQLGQQAVTEILIPIVAAPDAPSVEILSPAGEPGLIALQEDAVTTGSLLIFDADAADPAVLGVATALELLEALASDPGSLDAATLAGLAAALPTLANLDPIDTTAGGVLQLVPTANPLIFDFTYTPPLDGSGPDLAEIALAPLPGETEGGTVQLAFDIAPVNDAPFFTTDAPDPAAPVGFDVGEFVLIDLLAEVADVDSAVDPLSLVIDNAPDPALVDQDLTDGILTLTGLASGVGSFTFSIADEEGARSEGRTVFFDVNDVPIAVNDRVTVFDAGTSVLIDAIANDTDSDGTLSYVLGDDGLPQALDPIQAIDPDSAPGLLGTVVFSEADGAFLYTAPTDPALLGQTDQFFYEIVDDDGTTVRGSAVIELVSQAADAQSQRFGSTENDEIAAVAGVEQFLLGDGEDMISGALSAFDGDEIFDFTPDDKIIISDVAGGPVVLTVERDRGPLPDPVNPDPNAPTPAEVLGDTPIDELTSAFIGDTLLTVEAGGESSTIRLLGAFLGTFTATQTGDGVEISYDPALSGDGPLDGSDEDDDIRGNGVLNGNGGDDLLIGGDGPDSLFGGEGNDALIGGGGVNELTGGPGADLFLLTDPSDKDIITDFTPAEGDRIAVTEEVLLTEELLADLERFSIVETDTGFQLLGQVDDTDVPAPLADFTLPQPSTFAIGNVASEIEEGTGVNPLFVVEVVRTGNLDTSATVTVAISGAGAAPVDGDDFADGVPVTAVAVFAAGDDAATVSFEILADAVFEGDEGLQLTLIDPIGGVLDPDGATAEAVIVDDDLPTPDAVTATFTEDQANRVLDLLANAQDPNGLDLDVLDVSVTAQDERDILAQVDPETGLLTLNDGQFDDLAEGESLPIDVDYSVTNGISTVAATGTITITGVNDAPEVLADAAVTFAEDDDPILVTRDDLINPGVVRDPDTDLADLTAAALACCQNVSLNGEAIDLEIDIVSTIAGPETIWEIAAGQFEFLGTGDVLTFDATYLISDGIADPVENTVSVTITGENDGPDITSDPAFSVLEGETTVGQVVAEDPDDDLSDLSFSIADSKDGALFDIDTDGTVTFREAPDFEAPGGDGTNTYSLDVTVTDGDNVPDQQTLTVTVEDDPNDDTTEVPGTTGNDVLVGTDAADVIRSGGGPLDFLTGGGGGDTFVFEGTDNGVRELAYITDFEVGLDKIDLAGRAISFDFPVGNAVYLFLEGSDFDTLVVEGASSRSDIDFV